MLPTDPAPGFERTVAHLVNGLAHSVRDIAEMLRFRGTHLQEADELDRAADDLERISIEVAS